VFNFAAAASVVAINFSWYSLLIEFFAYLLEQHLDSFSFYLPKKYFKFE